MNTKLFVAVLPLALSPQALAHSSQFDEMRACVFELGEGDTFKAVPFLLQMETPKIGKKLKATAVIFGNTYSGTFTSEMEDERTRLSGYITHSFVLKENEPRPSTFSFRLTHEAGSELELNTHAFGWADFTSFRDDKGMRTIKSSGGISCGSTIEID